MTTRECCLGCGIRNAPMVCTGCRVARYCDVKCQTKGWATTHEVACSHFKAHFGKKGFALETNEEALAFISFLQTLTIMGRKRRGDVYTTTSSLCDEIIRVVHACLPEHDLDSIDTLAWHASVKQDLADHTHDDITTIDQAEQKQLWRNLPSAIAKLFITNGLRIRDAVVPGSYNETSISSAVELDRSRLTVLPPDVQLMLLEELPAYSIFAVIENLSDDMKKKVLLLIMDRDIIGPLKHAKVAPHEYLSDMILDRERLDSFSYSQLLKEYTLSTKKIATVLGANVTSNYIMNLTTSMTLEGRHFALVFQWNRQSAGAWMVHPVVSKRFFKILPNELSMLIRKFSSSASQKTLLIDSQPFVDLVMFVVEKIDPSVAWIIKPNLKHLWKKFKWPSPTGMPYEARLDTLVSGPETGYRMVAERRADEPPEATRFKKGTPVSSMEERLVYYLYQ
jgi:hypothetical protein